MLLSCLSGLLVVVPLFLVVSVLFVFFCVQPVMMRSALFCIVCNVFLCVVDKLGAQAVPAYSITVLMYCLYTVLVVSFCCPNFVPVSALRALSLGVHLCFISAM